MCRNSKSGTRNNANLGLPMARQFMGDEDALRLAEAQTRIVEAAAWLSRDVAEIDQILGRLRARRRVLIVSQSEQTREFARLLGQKHEVLLLATPTAAWELVSMNELDMVIVDHELHGPQDGLWLLEQILAGKPAVRRVLIARDELDGWEPHQHSGLLHRFLVKPVSLATLADLLAEESA